MATRNINTEYKTGRIPGDLSTCGTVVPVGAGPLLTLKRRVGHRGSSGSILNSTGGVTDTSLGLPRAAVWGQ